MEAQQEAPPAELGEVIAGYRLERILGQGGMGCVYEAAHALLGRKAAVKVLATKLAQDAEFVSRFFQEAKVVNDIRHPNIIDIFDFADQPEPKRVAYVMELLGGVSLKDALARGPFTVKQAVHACFQIAGALEAVHSVGVVHRDLKPDNIFVVASLESELDVVPSVKLLDFGVAKVVTADPAHKTRTGMILGTPSYMAPEQITAEPVSPATDVYALAEIFYEMVSGKKLFAGKEVSEILRAKLIGEHGELAVSDPMITEFLRAAMKLRPDERAKMPEVKARLLVILEAADKRPRLSAKRTPLIAAGGTAAVLALIIGMALLASRGEESPGTEPIAEAPAAVNDAGVAVVAARTPPKPPPKKTEKVESAPIKEPDPPPRERPREQSGPFSELDRVADAFQKAANDLGADLEIQSAETHARLGERALERKNYGAAKRHFVACLEKKNLPQCHLGLGQVFAREGEKQKAIKHLEIYLEMRPQAADAPKIRDLIAHLK